MTALAVLVGVVWCEGSKRLWWTSFATDPVLSWQPTLGLMYGRQIGWFGPGERLRCPGVQREQGSVVLQVDGIAVDQVVASNVGQDFDP